MSDQTTERAPGLPGQITPALDGDGRMIPPAGFITTDEAAERTGKTRRQIEAACRAYRMHVEREDDSNKLGDGVTSAPIEPEPRASDGWHVPDHREIACTWIATPFGVIYWPREDLLSLHRVHKLGVGGAGSYAGRRYEKGSYKRRTPREQDRRYRDVRERLMREGKL